MYDQSPSSSPKATAWLASSQWAPHHRLLSACIVTLSIALIFLVYFYFWRAFWRKPATAASASDSSSSPASSPAVSPKCRNRQELDQVVTSLPVFVYSGVGAGGQGTAQEAECAICFAEFMDGDEGRLLPLCGHRFHVGCVDMWFQFHSTCPLCRASVMAATEPKGGTSDTGIPTNMNMDSPV